MKIAVVHPAIWDPARNSLDPRLYADGFGALGHEAEVVCLEGSRIPAGAQMTTASRGQLTDAAYWGRREVDLALVFTWMGNFDVVQALRRSGAYVVSKGDTDGLMGVRVHPRATAMRALYPARSAIDGARRSWHWLKRYAYLYRREDDELLRTLAEADATIVETPAARTNLLRFLAHYDAAPLTHRLHSVRVPVHPRFSSGALEPKEANLVVSVGRWSDRAKDAGLLRRTLVRLSDCEAVVAGPDGERVVAGLPDRVRYVGPLAPDALKNLFTLARVCLVTSRWEGCHAAGHEALAMGCTIVGPPIPAVESMTLDGRFGVVTSGRAARDLAAAVRRELASWTDGQRDESAIAEYWRRQVHPEAVARQILALIPSVEGDRLRPAAAGRG